MLNWLKMNICEIEILNEQSYLKLRKRGKFVLNFCSDVWRKGFSEFLKCIPCPRKF